MSDISELVGKRIRDFRISQKMSQEELAHRAKLNASHLSAVELGKKSCTLDSLQKIVFALDITFQELFDFDLMIENIEEVNIYKITSYLKTLTQEEQDELYKTIRMLMRWKNNSREVDKEN